MMILEKKDDNCIIAEVDKKIVGIVWSRILSGKAKGYGNIDNETPELSISVLREYRNKGIGTKLMTAILKLLKEKGYKRASLSVQKENYASKLYMKMGFKNLQETSEEYIMVYELIDKVL